MKDPTRTPSPIIHRKEVHVHHPKCDIEAKNIAKKYGYCEHEQDILGYSQQLKKDREMPVAFDTNKTRRIMVKPTLKGTYK